jgi:hypothetical protein
MKTKTKINQRKTQQDATKPQHPLGETRFTRSSHSRFVSRNPEGSTMQSFAYQPKLTRDRSHGKSTCWAFQLQFSDRIAAKAVATRNVQEERSDTRCGHGRPMRKSNAETNASDGRENQAVRKIDSTRLMFARGRT